MDLADLTIAINPSSAARSVFACGGNLCADSRYVQPGDVFVAIKGARVDGHDYVDQAVAAGAKVVVTERPVALPDSVYNVVTKNNSRALGELAQAQHNWPARQLINLGVTGTNGKTTVAYLTRAMFQAAEVSCGLLGTIEYGLGISSMPAGNTTPDQIHLARMVNQMRQEGARAMVMECSSHGLDQDRTAGIPFTAAAFTNLSGDHLDYHGSTENYLDAKAKLFTSLDKDSVAVLNSHEKDSKVLEKSTEARVWHYGLDAQSEISGQVSETGIAGSVWQLRLHGTQMEIASPLIGQYNILNSLAAAGLACAADISVKDISEALNTFGGVPGRLQRIEGGDSFTVLVDYAHTDDALKNVLVTLRELRPNRIILLFGCGGQRDPSKRPRMAQVAQQYADRIVITSDNPRGESPQKILDDIKAGFTESGDTIIEVVDRRAAIETAINMAEKGDVLLIAGKGHEDYQEIEGKRYPFDDRQIAREILDRAKRFSSVNTDHQNLSPRREKVSS